MFNTDTNLSDINIENELIKHGINRTQSKINKGKKVCLSHEEHLLCVGKMPEYLTEFDIPKTVSTQGKSIDEMGWGQTVFDKLKLVVFTEPDKGKIQVGGSETEASVVTGLPPYTGAPQNSQSESSVGSSTKKGLPPYTGAPQNSQSESSVGSSTKKGLPPYTGAPSNNSSDSVSEEILNQNIWEHLSMLLHRLLQLIEVVLVVETHYLFLLGTKEKYILLIILFMNQQVLKVLKVI